MKVSRAGCSVSRSGRGLLSTTILRHERLCLLAVWARVWLGLCQPPELPVCPCRPHTLFAQGHGWWLCGCRGGEPSPLGTGDLRRPCARSLVQEWHGAWLLLPTLLPGGCRHTALVVAASGTMQDEGTYWCRRGEDSGLLTVCLWSVPCLLGLVCGEQFWLLPTMLHLQGQALSLHFF